MSNTLQAFALYSKNRVNTIPYFIFNYYKLTVPCCMENSVDPDQLASFLKVYAIKNIRERYLI